MFVRRLLVLAVVVMGSGLVSAGEEKAPSAATKAFDKIKKMEGSWVQIDDKGNVTNTVVSTYHVTAGGSAVIETIFPGTAHEMVTVYYIDKGELVLTHYCMLGNQPRMKADLSNFDKGSQIAFKFCGCGNLKDEKENHMHEAIVTLTSEDRYEAKWDNSENGKCTHSAAFKLARKK